MLGITKDQAQLISEHGAQIEDERQKAQKSLEAFGFNQDMVNSQSRAAKAINGFWFSVNNAWNDLLTTAEKPITTQLEKLDKWIEENPDAFKALMLLGGGVTAAGGAKVVGGLIARTLGFGGPANALTGSAHELSGSAKALDLAAEKLSASGGGGAGGKVAEAAEGAAGSRGILGWLSRGGPLQLFGKAGGTGASWLGGLSASTLLMGLQSGNKGLQDVMRQAHPDWSEEQMKDWVKSVQSGSIPTDEPTGPNLPGRPFTPTPAPQQPFIPSPPTGGDELERQINAQPEPAVTLERPINDQPEPAPALEPKINVQPKSATAPSWFKPWTWFSGKEIGT